ncbi:MAG TPA: hypothetical protein VNL91_03080 [Thermoanaerobaculia bacterium]|nr:hypothetical protein [Thermoanaerobaculia bacterium]
MRRTGSLIFAAALAVLMLSCQSDLSENAAPVELIVSNTQDLQRIDIAPGAENCDQNVGTITMQAVVKNPNQVAANQEFNRVRITRYRVSYVRTDGGKQVPAPFVRSIDTLLTPGSGSSGLTNFLILEQDALRQAPFAALLPTNGGRDPETGRSTVKMDVVVELFGQTLAGENVSASTRFSLDFCYNCNGCA